MAAHQVLICDAFATNDGSVAAFASRYDANMTSQLSFCLTFPVHSSHAHFKIDVIDENSTVTLSVTPPDRSGQTRSAIG